MGLNRSNTIQLTGSNPKNIYKRLPCTATGQVIK